MIVYSEEQIKQAYDEGFKAGKASLSSSRLLCDGWREVKKELPIVGEEVLIYFNKYGKETIVTARFQSDSEIMENIFAYGKHGVLTIKDCIAWMPLTEIGKPAFV